MGRWDRENEWDSLFFTAASQEAARAGVTPYFLMALAKAHCGRESGFSPTAYSYDGPDPVKNASRGLMQIEGITALDAGVPVGDNTDTFTGPNAPHDYARTAVPQRTAGLYDPNIAIPFGVHIIAANLAATKGNVDEAIAAYNEGLGRAHTDVLNGGAFRVQGYVNDVKSNLSYFLGTVPSDSGSIAETSLTPNPAAGGL